MEKMTEEQILNLIQSDAWMMQVISTASSLGLKDWVIGAGFVRNKVWDHLSGNQKTGVDTPDIDLVYYDPNGNNEEADEKLSKDLNDRTGFNWEVVNEYYAHTWNNLPPYTSTADAISQWADTATAIGVTQDDLGNLRLIAPYGISDLVNFIVRPTPAFMNRIDIFRDRIEKKKWLEKWPRIRIEESAK